MHKSLIIIFAVTSALASFSVQAEPGVIPRIMDVAYVNDISGEPVLVQKISVSGVSGEAANDAIIRAARGRKWACKELENGDIEAKLVHRSFDSTLTFKLREGTIEVWSVSYKTSYRKSNKKYIERKKREEPESWIRNLHKDILVYLVRFS